MSEKKPGLKHAPERKNLDELEILRVIISENPQLKKKVLRKIEEIQEEHSSGAKKAAKKKIKRGL